jgi:hypothetical protein
VKPVIDRVVLEIGNISGHIDDCHAHNLPVRARTPVASDHG